MEDGKEVWLSGLRTDRTKPVTKAHIDSWWEGDSLDRMETAVPKSRDGVPYNYELIWVEGESFGEMGLDMEMRTCRFRYVSWWNSHPRC